jgi:hypothetical protein
MELMALKTIEFLEVFSCDKKPPHASFGEKGNQIRERGKNLL